ncbi:MAG: Photosystem I assembly protein Ycf3 [Phycisphaerae bacterium]|nr:Photosystem I assembly protein Ycf3 [Phycisphaerae bacterium]
MAVTLLAYSPLHSAGFIWDDDFYVTENPTLQTSAGLLDIWTSLAATPQYYPLVFTSFWLEYQLWGNHPLGYHAVNVLLHIGSALLLWLFLQRLQIPGAYWAALCFALHPVMVESVAWITEHKNTLSLFFALVTLHLYWRYLARPRRGIYITALIAFAAALLSKTVTGSLPAVILVLLWWRHGRWERRQILPLLPFLMLAAVMGAITIWVERHHVGAQGVEWSLAPWTRFALAGRIICFYALKLIGPVSLSFVYPRWEATAFQPSICLFPILVIGVLLICWRRRQRWGRGPVAALLIYCGVLFPALGFVDVYPFRYSFVADHFQYHASLALLVFIVTGFEQWRRGRAVPLRRLGSVLGIIVLVLLGWQTEQRCRVYRDAETLWRDTLAWNPDAWIAANNLGLSLVTQRRYAEAEPILERARSIAVFPRDRSRTLRNLAHLYRETQRLELAQPCLEEALSVQPNWILAWADLADVLERRGQLDPALDCWQKILLLNPNDAHAAQQIGLLYADRGDVNTAEKYLRRAVQLQPERDQLQLNLGVVKARQGDLRSAKECFEAAIRLNPQSAEAFFNLGLTLLHLNDRDAARTALQRTLDLQPDHAAARQTLLQLEKLPPGQ